MLLGAVGTYGVVMETEWSIMVNMFTAGNTKLDKNSYILLCVVCYTGISFHTLLCSSGIGVLL